MSHKVRHEVFMVELNNHFCTVGTMTSYPFQPFSNITALHSDLNIYISAPSVRLVTHTSFIKRLEIRFLFLSYTIHNYISQ
jgi:hypothetical protein